MSATGARLDALLERVEAVTERAAAATRAAPVDPAVRAALVAVAGEDAPRDPDGLWRDPAAAGPEGVRLVQRAIVHVAGDVRRAATGHG
ncbi:hypothetical protein [Nocardioides dongkuii]|uniref:hypothetical protein n=1 Tax=Nocardioides dongkuii TaxID=2760089 RepID=UPI0015FCC6A1|nr:hypothetical protein [Nocardioides dongkuii]